MSARNNRSEFIANLGLVRGTSVTVDCTKMSVKSGNLSSVINAGFNCTSEKFWAVPSASRLCGSHSGSSGSSGSSVVTAKTSAFTATEKAEKVMNLRSKSFKFRLNALLLIRAVFVWSVV